MNSIVRCQYVSNPNQETQEGKLFVIAHFWILQTVRKECVPLHNINKVFIITQGEAANKVSAFVSDKRCQHRPLQKQQSVKCNGNTGKKASSPPLHTHKHTQTCTSTTLRFNRCSSFTLNHQRQGKPGELQAVSAARSQPGGSLRKISGNCLLSNNIFNTVATGSSGSRQPLYGTDLTTWINDWGQVWGDGTGVN